MSVSRDVVNDMNAWLQERVALYLDQPPESIELDTPLTDYGMNSVYAISVLGDIEDDLGIEIPDLTVMWDHPTVRRLADHLQSLRSGTEHGG